MLSYKTYLKGIIPVLMFGLMIASCGDSAADKPSSEVQSPPNSSSNPPYNPAANGATPIDSSQVPGAATEAKEK